MRWLFSLLLFCFVPFCLLGQSAETKEKPFAERVKEKTSLRGYIKDLHQLYFFDKPENWKLNNIIHQRTVLRVYLNDEWTLGTEARSQVIYGSYPRLINGILDENRALIDALNQLGTFGKIPTTYGAFFSGNPGPLDLHFLLVDQSEMTAWTTIDRLWLDWSKGKFEMRLGKQRVNWGINWVWNPNDLFNTYNFTDFDYEERAASDALRLQYYYSTVNKVELVFAAGTDFEQNTIGLLWKVNKWNYDFQFIAASYQGDPAAGLGWSGNIGTLGFKGEATYLFSSDNKEGLVASLGLDYAFPNGLVLQAESLYNNFGASGDLPGIDFTQTLSPRTLSQYKWSSYFGGQASLSPRSLVGLGLIFQPSDQTYYLAPSFSYSLAQNVDFLVIGQFVGKQSVALFPGVDTGLGNFYGLLNTRLKWSF